MNNVIFFCAAVCSFHLDGYTDNIFSYISHYSSQSLEQAFQKVKDSCDSRPNNDGNLYWAAEHGGPDNQHTLATIEESCKIKKLGN